MGAGRVLGVGRGGALANQPLEVTTVIRKPLNRHFADMGFSVGLLFLFGQIVPNCHMALGCRVIMRDDTMGVG